jgi:hypothetical protein
MQQRWIVDLNSVKYPQQFTNQDARGNPEGTAWVQANVSKPTAGTFSTQRTRNYFYNPGFQNWNAGLFKNFPISEKFGFFTFRAEAFNFLNHPNWSGADTNPNSRYFGMVTNKDSNQPNRNLQLSLRYTF